jgi:hypothetical protein
MSHVESNYIVSGMMSLRGKSRLEGVDKLREVLLLRGN